MAKLSKERYLVLSVDDSQEDALNIQLALSEKQRLNFIGSFADGQTLATHIAGQGSLERIKFAMPDLLQLDLLMSRKGFEIVEWLQNQPFEDVVVFVLPPAGKKKSRSSSAHAAAVTLPPEAAVKPQPVDLVNLLEHYLSRES